jgi:hypothetical protein
MKKNEKMARKNQEKLKKNREKSSCAFLESTFLT